MSDFENIIWKTVFAIAKDPSTITLSMSAMRDQLTQMSHYNPALKPNTYPHISKESSTFFAKLAPLIDSALPGSEPTGTSRSRRSARTTPPLAQPTPATTSQPKNDQLIGHNPDIQSNESLNPQGNKHPDNGKERTDGDNNGPSLEPDVDIDETLHVAKEAHNTGTDVDMDPPPESQTDGGSKSDEVGGGSGSPLANEDETHNDDPMAGPTDGTIGGADADERSDDKDHADKSLHSPANDENADEAMAGPLERSKGPADAEDGSEDADRAKDKDSAPDDGGDPGKGDDERSSDSEDPDKAGRSQSLGATAKSKRLRSASLSRSSKRTRFDGTSNPRKRLKSKTPGGGAMYTLDRRTPRGRSSTAAPRSVKNLPPDSTMTVLTPAARLKTYAPSTLPPSTNIPKPPLVGTSKDLVSD